MSTALLTGIQVFGRVSLGTATVATMFLSMPSDNAKFNEQQERRKLVDRIIADAFPGVVEHVEYCLVGVGWPCLDQGWSVVDEKRYAELAPAVEKLVEKPFEPRRIGPPIDFPVTEEASTSYRCAAHEDPPPPPRRRR